MRHNVAMLGDVDYPADLDRKAVLLRAEAASASRLP
jgi:hypothetical protein